MKNNVYKFNVMYFLRLPIEIQDEIFLLCDFNILENTREYQSAYVKRCTEYFSFNNLLNKLNLKWLFYQSVRWGIYMHDRVFLLACINSDMHIIKFIYKPRMIDLQYQYNGFNSVVSQGNIDNVILLHNIGVSWDKRSIDMSKKKGHDRITEWLLKNKK